MGSASVYSLFITVLVAAAILASQAKAAPLMDDCVDSPTTDYKALFQAFLDMGDAFIGTGKPGTGNQEEFINMRDAFRDD
ncbi:hypothetical protein KR018_010806 [Drosophila ironensis]|nr:hypothetical protein KR018_010806 [Drosophila ironensis]